MAEMDKNAIFNLLEGVLGQEKAKEAGSLLDALPIGKEEAAPVSSTLSQSGNDDLIDTAQMMQQVSGLMNRFREAKNTKEVHLLSALKPYLRASRQPKVDSCLKILQAYEVFHTMKKSGKIP